MATAGPSGCEIFVMQVDENGQAIVINAANNFEVANERDSPMKDYDVFDPTTMDIGIVRPSITATQFEFKLMMFQMLQIVGPFGGYTF